MDMLMQQAQMMKQKFDAMQEDLKKQTVEASSGGGMVKAVVNGSGELVSIVIDPAVVDPNDVDMLQDLIVLSVNEAQRQMQSRKEESMKKLTGGLSIPGLF